MSRSQAVRLKAEGQNAGTLYEIPAVQKRKKRALVLSPHERLFVLPVFSKISALNRLTPKYGWITQFKYNFYSIRQG